MSDTTYFVIANYPEKGRFGKELPHAAFLQAMLPRAEEKLGARPGLVRCHPQDRDAIATAIPGVAIVTSDLVQPCEFWLALAAPATEAAQ